MSRSPFYQRTIIIVADKGPSRRKFYFCQTVCAEPTPSSYVATGVAIDASVRRARKAILVNNTGNSEISCNEQEGVKGYPKIDTGSRD